MWRESVEASTLVTESALAVTKLKSRATSKVEAPPVQAAVMSPWAIVVPPKARATELPSRPSASGTLAVKSTVPLEDTERPEMDGTEPEEVRWAEPEAAQGPSADEPSSKLLLWISK